MAQSSSQGTKTLRRSEVIRAFGEARTLSANSENSEHEAATTPVDFARAKWVPLRAKSLYSFICLYAFLFLVLFVNLFFWAIPGFNLLFVGYWIWILTIDANASRTSGRPWQWFKSCNFFSTLAKYFPMSLYRTQELDPGKTYIFGYHPHGVISLGALVCFATEGAGFASLFPGIDLRLLTLRVNFLVPLLREALMWLGICDVSKESIMNHINRGSGSAVMIVIGGAEESLKSQTGSYSLILKNRKGFVKLGLITGSSLVPVFSFGETDLFEVGSSKGWTAWMQNTMKKCFGFTLPLFMGRGIWLTSGLLPLNKPVHVVVGKPIDCPKVENPTSAQIDEYHEKYVEALIDVFNANKKNVGMNRLGELRIG